MENAVVKQLTIDCSFTIRSKINVTLSSNKYSNLIHIQNPTQFVPNLTCFITAYIQGFCGKTQWLDITRNGIPICIRNPCTSHIRGSKKDFVYFQSRCVEVGESWSGCDQDQVVGFKMFRRLPTCISSHSIPASARAIGVPTTPCDLGSVMALDGRCNPPFEFD